MLFGFHSSDDTVLKRYFEINLQNTSISKRWSFRVYHVCIMCIYVCVYICICVCFMCVYLCVHIHYICVCRFISLCAFLCACPITAGCTSISERICRPLHMSWREVLQLNMKMQLNTVKVMLYFHCYIPFFRNIIFFQNSWKKLRIKNIRNNATKIWLCLLLFQFNARTIKLAETVIGRLKIIMKRLALSL